MSTSAIFEGTVRHRRRAPVDHAFTYDICMLYVDLDAFPAELDAHRLWSSRHAALGRFRRADHFGEGDLADAVRDEVARQTGVRPEGPVRLLSTPRTFGHAFNPVSFYYCFDATGEHVHTVLAEVTNTPWGEVHLYVMDPAERPAGAPLTDELPKAFHVSPFMGMDHRYTWRLTEPGDRLAVAIASDRDGERVFDAALDLRRRPLDHRGLTRILTRYPLATVRTMVRIYGQALRLKLKGAPYFPHPPVQRPEAPST